MARLGRVQPAHARIIKPSLFLLTNLPKSSSDTGSFVDAGEFVNKGDTHRGFFAILLLPPYP